MLPLVSHGEYADGTDRQTDERTPDRYNALTARRGQLNKHTTQNTVVLCSAHWLFHVALSQTAFINYKQDG